MSQCDTFAVITVGSHHFIIKSNLQDLKGHNSRTMTIFTDYINWRISHTQTALECPSETCPYFIIYLTTLSAAQNVQSRRLNDEVEKISKDAAVT
jgi:hypothetical protein